MSILRDSPPLLNQEERLKELMSLKPMPPLNIGMQILSQPIQWILCSVSFWPYQKLAIRCSRSIQRVLGILKQLTANVGMARTTALIRTSFLLWDKSFPFHIWNHCHTLVFIFEKAFLLELLILFGHPTTPQSRDISFILVTNIPIEHHGSLVIVYALSRGMSIHIKDFLEIFWHIDISFTKNETIIRKKELVNRRCPMTNSNAHKTFINHSLSQQVNQTLSA